MFLGTSAKVYFFACACAPVLAASSAAAATLSVSAFMVSSCLPLLPALSRRAPAADPLEQNRQHDEEADEGALPVGVDAGHQKGIADDFDERCANHGSVGPAHAAHEIG